MERARRILRLLEACERANFISVFVRLRRLAISSRDIHRNDDDDAPEIENDRAFDRLVVIFFVFSRELHKFC